MCSRLLCVFLRGLMASDISNAAVFSLFLWACAITSQFEFLHLLMYLHMPKKTTTVLAAFSPKKPVNRAANHIQHEEMNEPALSLTSF